MFYLFIHLFVPCITYEIHVAFCILFQEVMFLPFSLRDVERGGTLTKGDVVSFLIATDRR